MKREEQIIETAKEYYNPKNGSPYSLQMRTGFITGTKWADEAMMEKMCEWLETNIDKYSMVVQSIDGDKLEEKIVLTKSFKENFIKSMEE